MTPTPKRRGRPPKPKVPKEPKKMGRPSVWSAPPSETIQLTVPPHVNKALRIPAFKAIVDQAAREFLKAQ